MDDSNMTNQSYAARVNVLNGPRPSPLRLHKDSHVIHKPKLNPPRKQPVIIYTHSPKIIHTKPKDFMALVQKLTGFTRPDNDDHHDDEYSNKKSDKCGPQTDHHYHQDNDSSSVTSDEQAGRPDHEMSPVHQKALKTHPHLNDFPLFTPNNSNTLFSASPQALFRYPDAIFASPNISLSPSFVEFMKGLPEY
ncbi:OLC1v1032269C1 [Oldenlandia corymbosa var. corymbosa]|uniref:OLC1v1032269C1 n=1 Tax=Oldenlandia corymbosa var. corymbosa TaxID=529605 RepID=A0AAV1CKC4_OLDCO|nr:OLC1v1032269C1 [Oldenlandia corymbosa var. corymbosa]